jgi:hypothetical protein
MNVSVLLLLCSLEGGGAEGAVYQLDPEQRRRGRESDVLVEYEAGIYVGALAR